MVYIYKHKYREMRHLKNVKAESDRRKSLKFSHFWRFSGKRWKDIKIREF